MHNIVHVEMFGDIMLWCLGTGTVPGLWTYHSNRTIIQTTLHGVNDQSLGDLLVIRPKMEVFWKTWLIMGQ